MEDTFHLGIKALVRNKDGNILLLQLDPRELGGEFWDIPGGRVQRGHSVAETLKREIQEETGVTKVTIGKKVGIVLSPIRIKVKDADNDVGLILDVYECTLPQEAVIQPDDGLVAYEWVAPTVAAKRLSNKYPPEFCRLIAEL